MDIDNKLNEYMNENQELPEKLLPENISVMLTEKPEQLKIARSARFARKLTWAAGIAATALLAVGMTTAYLSGAFNPALDGGIVDIGEADEEDGGNDYPDDSDGGGNNDNNENNGNARNENNADNAARGDSDDSDDSVNSDNSDNSENSSNTQNPSGSDNSDNPDNSGSSGNQTNPNTPTEDLNLQAEIKSARDYSEIYKLIKEKNDEFINANNKMSEDNSIQEVAEEPDFGGVNDAPAPAPPSGINDGEGGSADANAGDDEAAAVTDRGSGGESDYSDTNNQVEGVQEGDIVKTDGKNIYIASSYYEPCVNVIKTDNGKMKKIAALKRENASPSEMLLYGDKLVIIWSKSAYKDRPITNDDTAAAGAYDRAWGYYDNEVIVDVYDTKGSFDKPYSTYAQKGHYKSSRMMNNNIYIVTTFNPPIGFDEFKQEDYDRYVPSYTVNGKKKFLAADCIVVPEKLDFVEYTVIGGLDVNSDSLFVSSEARLGQAYVIYSSLKNIYITGYAWEAGAGGYGEEFTDIAKFSLNNGWVDYAASGRIRGGVNNQFCMDEYNGNLRVVSMVYGWKPDMWGWQSTTEGASLYALDSNLNIISRVKGIGEGEQLQSVRFDGATAYLVTFRNTDPLFAFDMSDPANPVKLGELKIPGFSRYLHKWSDGLLLGVGVDADETNGGRTGLKISMFDVSGDAELSEVHKYVIGTDGYNYTIAEWDHKAVLVSPEKNIIAFPYVDYGNNKTVCKYAIFSYDKKTGFTLVGEIERNSQDYYWNGFARGVYIGDYIYVISEGGWFIVSSRIDDVNIIEEVVLADPKKYYDTAYDDMVYN